MKANIKNITLIISIVIVSATFNLSADNSNIELPDLTTVVTSEQKDIEEIAIPDFADVVVPPENAGKLVLEMPEVEVLEKGDVIVSEQGIENKQVYVEGEAGGGLPASFLGTFSVSRITGNEPFKIEFTHESENGFANHSLSSGYFDRLTNINFNKTFAWNVYKLDISGIYENTGNGLQSQENDIFSVNQNMLSGSGKFNWDLRNGFNIGTKLDLDYYYRFSNVTPNAVCDNFVEHSAVMEIVPTIYGQWTNGAFTAELDGNIYLNADLQKAYQPGHQFSNRGDFDLSGNWVYKQLKLYGGAGIVFGDNLKDCKIIAPFNLGLSTSFPVYYSDRNTVINIEGGLESHRNTNKSLEKKYLYTALDIIPSETTNWYGDINVSIPLKTEFTGDLGLKLRKTAFGNGEWEPVYEDSSYNSGIYTYSQNEKFIVATDVALTYRHKMFAGTIKYHANWKETPAMENRQNIYLDMSFQDPEVKWGVNTTAAFSLDGSDKIPFLNFEGFVGISPQVKIVLKSEDILKFFDPQPRTCAGKYITDSGNVKILVKFIY